MASGSTDHREWLLRALTCRALTNYLQRASFRNFTKAHGTSGSWRIPFRFVRDDIPCKQDLH